jgi:NADH-quinone oxidoreductase subunit J
MDPASLLYAASFYLFAGVTLFAALMVVLSRQPVHAVLFLILAFFSSAGLIVLQGAEFLAMILIIVYVGAVAVLFLFVVMMLNTSGATGAAQPRRYWFFGLLMGLVLLAQLLVYFLGRGRALTLSEPAQPPENSLEALGGVLYDDYFVFFQLAGLILLVAMIGAIVLTLRKREAVKRQDIAAQVARRREEGVTLKSPKSGEGL